MSACALIANAYRGCDAYRGSDGGGDEYSQNEVLKIFWNLCTQNLEPPMVHSAAAGVLGDLVMAMMEQGAAQKTAPDKMYDFLCTTVHKEKDNGLEPFCIFDLYTNLLQGSHDYVKAAAVKSSAAVFRHCPGNELSRHCAAQAFKDCATDKYWKMRHEVAKVLPDVVVSFRKGKGESVELGAGMQSLPDLLAADVKFVKEIAHALLDDAEEEVKLEMAARVPSLAEAMGPKFAQEELFHKVREIYKENPNDAKLAGVMMEMATTMKSAAAKELIFDEMMFDEMMAHESIDVKFAALGKLSRVLDHVNLFEANGESSIVDTLQKNAREQHKWRVRHAVLMLLPKVAEVYKRDMAPNHAREFSKKFGWWFIFNDENTENEEMVGAADLVAKIRTDYVEVASEVCKVLGTTEEKAPSIVSVPNVIHVLEHFASKKYKDKYHYRSGLMIGLVKMAEYMKDDDVIAQLRDNCFPMANENTENNFYIPSLRLIIARELPKVADILIQRGKKGAAFAKSEIKAALNALALDQDCDVKGFAEAGLSSQIWS